LLQFAPIADCIDRALDGFGRGTRDMIYMRMQTENKFTREDTIYKPDEFKTHLEGMFVTGSKLFERSITREIAREFRMELQSNFDLVGAIQGAKEILSAPQAQAVIA
jgi:hypothetical protein